MNKFGAVLFIIICVVFSYIILTAVHPALRGMVSSANASLPADMSAYPGGREGLLSMPWLLYFIPAVIGIVALIIVLKTRSE